MAEIINLRTVKKRQARAYAAAAAQQNRIRHGQTKVAKANDARETAQREARLDALRRDTEPT